MADLEESGDEYYEETDPEDTDDQVDTGDQMDTDDQQEVEDAGTGHQKTDSTIPNNFKAKRVGTPGNKTKGRKITPEQRKKPPQVSTKKPPQVTAKKPPKATAKKPPKVTAKKPPKITAKKPPKVTAKKPPKVTTNHKKLDNDFMDLRYVTTSPP